jgi:hypothetical protein
MILPIQKQLSFPAPKKAPAPSSGLPCEQALARKASGLTSGLNLPKGYGVRLPAFLDFRRPTPVQFGCLLALLILIAFYDVAFGLRTFVTRDFGICNFPIAFHQREAFWNGEFPLWNPLSSCGQPFMAEWATLALYPPALIYLLLPMPWSLGIFLLAHLWFAGFGMFRLALRWTRHPLAASIAGIGFALNGFNFNCLMWPAFLSAIAFMPWVIVAVQKAWVHGGRKLVLGAFAGALQMLTGGPEPILFTWFFIFCIAVLDLVKPQTTRQVLIGRLSVVVLLVALLSAAQILPFVDLLAHSQRSSGYADATWSMPGWGFANFLVPLFRFCRAPQGVFYQSNQYFTSSYYLGIGLLAFACSSILVLRERRVCLTIFVTVLFLTLALGDNAFLFPLVKKVFPAIGFMRYPMKFVVLPVFSIPLLAAYGFKAVEPVAPNKRIRVLSLIVAFFVVCIGLIVWFSRAYPLPNEVWQSSMKSGLSRAEFLILILFLVFALFKARLEQAASLGLLLVLSLDIFTHSPWQNPTVPSSVFQPGIIATKLSPTPAFGEGRILMTRATHDRIYNSMLPDGPADYLGRRLGLLANCNLLDNIPSADGFFPLYLRASRDVWSKAFFAEISPTPLLNFLGVSLISHPTEFLEWQRRTNYLPLITIGQKPLFTADSNTLIELVSTNFNPEETVYLTEAARPAVTVTDRVNGKIIEPDYRAERIHFKTRSQEPALVVISQSYYHNWHAFVDGAAVPLLRANYGFQALQVPGGVHQVSLKYIDEKFRVGLAFSLGTLLICAWWLVRKGT